MLSSEDVRQLNQLPGGVIVLCGGPGGEREVSLQSGRTAHEGLTSAGVVTRLVVVPETSPGAFLETVGCGLAVMMLHGEFGEDGEAQEILEQRGIAYTGSDAASCRLTMDKNATKLVMRECGVPTAAWCVASEPGAAPDAVREAGLSLPVFVKPNAGGSSVGSSRVDEWEALPAAVEAALATGSALAMVEELVAGRELTVGWLDGRSLPIIEMSAEGVFYDYHAKYTSRETQYRCPAALEPGMEEAIRNHALRLAEATRLRDLGRVDVMLGSAGPMVLEVNALPGFTSHSLLPMAAGAAGIPIEELCVRLAGMAASRLRR